MAWTKARLNRSYSSSSLQRAATPLGGDGQGAVLDEAARIEQVVDVLPRRPVAGLATSGDSLGPVGVEGEGVAVDDLLQVGPDVVGVDQGGFRLRVGGDIGGLEEQDRLALEQGLSLRRGDADHPAALGRGDDMLHLHGFEDGHGLAGGDQVALDDLDQSDGGQQRRRDGDRPFEILEIFLRNFR